jgi:hypothetical protein
MFTLIGALLIAAYLLWRFYEPAKETIEPYEDEWVLDIIQEETEDE